MDELVAPEDVRIQSPITLANADIISELREFEDIDELMLNLLARASGDVATLKELIEIARDESIESEYRVRAFEVVVDVKIVDATLAEKVSDCARLFLQSSSPELRFCGVSCLPNLGFDTQKRLEATLVELASQDSDLNVRRVARVHLDLIALSNES